jgi:hypothetical protein
MSDRGLRQFVSDLSLGREPYRIIFDSRSSEECKLLYLESSSASATSSPRGITANSKGNIAKTEEQVMVAAAHTKQTSSPRTSNGFNASPVAKDMRARKERGMMIASSQDDSSLKIARGGNTRGRPKKQPSPSLAPVAMAEERPTSRGRGRPKKGNGDERLLTGAWGDDAATGEKFRGARKRGASPAPSEGNSSDESSDTLESPRAAQGERYSNRVFALSNDVADVLALELDQWKLRYVYIIVHAFCLCS